MPIVPMSLSGIPYKLAFVLTHLNPLLFHSALPFQTSGVSGKAPMLHVIVKSDLLVQNNGLPLLRKTGIINSLIITGLFPSQRPHFWNLLDCYLATSSPHLLLSQWLAWRLNCYKQLVLVRSSEVLLNHSASFNSFKVL